jgi:hypothetical protein
MLPEKRVGVYVVGHVSGKRNINELLESRNLEGRKWISIPD